MIYLKLFFEFFKIGLFAIGGGMATVPFLMDLSAKTNWYSAADLADMIAISESTPGPIGVNMATYVGFNTSGIFGSLCSTLGLITPSVIIIILVYFLMMHFIKYNSVQTVLKYLRASVIGLISFALVQVARICIFDGSKILILPAIAIVIFTILIVRFKKIHPIVWILSGALVGLLFF